MNYTGLLEGKVAFVTGATRGIGFAISQTFASAGARTVMTGRDSIKLLESIESIKSKYPYADVQSLICDVTDPKSVKDAFQALLKSHKKLDILVSNAGVLDDALISMVTKDQIERTYATNTYSVIYCAQYASRIMNRNGGGSIINISSIIGTNGNFGQAVYAGSKAAVIGISKSLSKELATQGIRVNAIAPGFIETDMAKSIPADKYEERLNSIKMGRIGSPDEVANVALFLGSDLSTYVTGQVIGVDGGMLI